MYGYELPASLIKQVTKIGDRAFLTIEETHHLLTDARGTRKRQREGIRIDIVVRVLSFYLTRRSAQYTFETERPMLRSSGSGGTGHSAPGISCVAGSSQANSVICSRISSWVSAPAAARRCLSMVRQYSSAQLWSTLLRRKTEANFQIVIMTRRFWVKEILAFF